MKLYMAIGMAGAIGSVLRYVIGIYFFTQQLFPFPTLIVNLIGCYLLARLTTVLFQKMTISGIAKNAISSGLIGSFTTFSAFSVETVELIESGHIGLASVYVITSMMGGIVFSRLGFHVGKGNK